MRSITTDSGVTIQVVWFFGGYGSPKWFSCEIPNPGKSVAQVAQEMEGIKSFVAQYEDGTKIQYDGYTVVQSISKKPNGNIQITLEHPE